MAEGNASTSTDGTSEIEQMEVAACNETTKGMVSSAGRGVCESALPPGRYGSRSAQHESQDLSTKYVLQPDGEIKGRAKLVNDARSQDMGALRLAWLAAAIHTQLSCDFLSNLG